MQGDKVSTVEYIKGVAVFTLIRQWFPHFTAPCNHLGRFKKSQCLGYTHANKIRMSEGGRLAWVCFKIFR